ncbi:MAG: aspartyl/asparaginyl beta-hydroxylase domain-containing protein [Asticcacaulis sp.]
MYFDGEYRQLGNVDPQPLCDVIARLSEEEWNAAALRQQVFKAHSTTQSINLIFDDDFRHAEPTIHADFTRFEGLLRPVMQQIASYYAKMAPARLVERAAADPYFVRAILVRLQGGTVIAPHYDNGYSLTRAHRIHYPVITNPKAIFSVNGVERHLKAGEIWEINNRRLHAVRNDGEDRIHFIFDYVIPGELIDTPTGQAVA